MEVHSSFECALSAPFDLKSGLNLCVLTPSLVRMFFSAVVYQAFHDSGENGITGKVLFAQIAAGSATHDVYRYIPGSYRRECD